MKKTLARYLFVDEARLEQRPLPGEFIPISAEGEYYHLRDGGGNDWYLVVPWDHDYDAVIGKDLQSLGRRGDKREFVIYQNI